MKFQIIALLSLFTFLISCHRDTGAPGLTITTPVENAAISGKVTISGTVTDKSLHQMTIKVLNDAGGAVLFTKVITEIHDLESYNFNETYTPTGITAATPVTLTVEVEDHNEHSTLKAVRFTLLP